MERVIALTVDEASVVIGLLDVPVAAEALHPQLAEMAHRYRALLMRRVVQVPDDGEEPVALVDRIAHARLESERLRGELGAAIAEGRRLRARRDELVSACRAALQLLGTDGALGHRPPHDSDLADVRSLLATVTAA